MSTIITKKQFPNYRKYTMDLAGRPLTLETGKLAELANAAVLVTYGETTVLVTASASARPRDGIDFFPLSVDLEEKMCTPWAASPAALCAVRAGPVRRASSPAASSTGPSVPCSPMTSATTCPSWLPS